MKPNFPLRPDAKARCERIGRSGEPVFVIDDLLTDPGSLIDHAAASVRFTAADEGRGGYPGVRAPLPRDYVSRLITKFDPIIRQTFALSDVALGTVECAFSIVTTNPASLHPMQRIPHIDIANPLRFALLHFLCGSPHGGTAFFRQESTGLEQIAAADLQTYRAARAADLARLEPGSGYPDDRTPGYVPIAQFDARMNRLLLYRSFSIHSGIIPTASRLDPDPRSGRLTANIFLDYAQISRHRPTPQN